MGRRRVLLVDDDEAVAKGFARVLETAGYETQYAGDGLVAEKVLLKATFDVAVIDLFMPEREGLETIREVHRLYPDMGIVVASGGFGTVDVALWLKVARALGASAALKKPVSSGELLGAVLAALSGPVGGGGFGGRS
ncbi:MAG: response regulator [Polyangiaceae bacterium]|jgi:CheY-like chemotaxis protein